tara:strand:- start:567 stop:1265 length:699 start_codon:yes stop_codon:yes gene_type:complete
MLKKQKPNYDEVSSKTWIYSDLKENNLKFSKSLFEFKNKIIVPKRLEVLALLSGLPFSKLLTYKILYIQKEIDKIIGDTKHYWVKRNNLGLEYCVFKWPEEKLNQSDIKKISKFVSNINIEKFNVFFDGCQLNPDGCIVVKGFDVSKNISNIRDLISKNISFLPKKQSNWFHIPIGRILEPVGQKNFLKLKKFFDKNNKGWGHYEKVKNIKLIYEYQWYMTDRKMLFKIKNY